MKVFNIKMKVDVEMIMERYGLEEDEAVEMLEAFVDELEGRSMSGMSGVVNILEMANVFDN